MDEIFKTHIESLEPSYQALLSMKPHHVASLPRGVPTHGIYLFTENGEHLYVGRSNQLRTRLQTHCRPSSGHNSATFAFRLAREETGRLTATYVARGSRKDLEKDPEFADAFSRAKDRVRGMQVRFVEESDAMRQALLEMYVAVSVDAPYNDFDNH